MSTATIEDLGALINAAIKAYGEDTPRSRQSQDGIIGPSDLGFCRQKAVLMTKGVERSDSQPIMAAQIGTAVHEYFEKALKAMFPTWLIESHRVTATFPSEAKVSGTFDIIVPEWNALIDIKTTKDLSWIKRNGISQNHNYQRHTYALGAMQEGLLDGTKPVYVGNLYIDKSNEVTEPYLVVSEFDWTIIDEIDSWISDVQYAVMQKEDASRDIPAPVCEKICAYFTACRGGMLPVNEGQEIIESGEIVDAVEMLLEARDQIKKFESQKRSATNLLQDVNALVRTHDGTFQTRTTYVNPTMVPAQERNGYTRVDVRRVKNSQ